jgi:glycosyltransferase involved in cell wall biosynthesis
VTVRRVASFEMAFVEETLERLSVTDTVYHDLRYSQPLAAEILAAIRRRPAAKRVLLIAANTTLEPALTSLGYEVDAWQAQGATPAGESLPGASVTRPLDDLLVLDGVDGKYDVVVIPFVLEATAEEPVVVLERIRSVLARQAAVIVVSRHPGALDRRLRALTGRTTIGDDEDDRRHVSWSWPVLPRRRLFSAGTMRSWCRDAAFQVADQRFVLDREAYLRVDAFGLTRWAGTTMAHRLKLAVPTLRDCVLQVLEPLSTRFAATNVEPRVSVVVSAGDRDRATALVRSLGEQTYPADRTEIVILHAPGTLPLGDDAAGSAVRRIETPRPDGPAAANAALLEATGDVICFTDDRCRVPPGWIRAGVGHLHGTTVAAAGAVMADEGSPVAYLVGPDPIGGRSTFQASNVFYVREALQEASGFDDRFEGHDVPAWGWSASAARRLARLGYSCDLDETLYVFRKLPDAEDVDGLRAAYAEARAVPWGVRAAPEQRDGLHLRLFASPRTFAFDLLVMGATVAAVRRRTAWLVLALPWIRTVGRHMDLWPPAEWRGTARRLAWITAHQATWLGGTVAGSVGSRRPVL